MAVLARRIVPCDPAPVWRVLSDITAWPTWVDSIATVESFQTAETPDPRTDDGDVIGRSTVVDHIGHSAYRIEQPPLPSTLWSLTRWEPGRGFAWQSRAPTNLVSEQYHVETTRHGTLVTIDVTWSGRTAWFARATYGPVRKLYAVEQLQALMDP
ncbi:MAG: SRPBCC family protein [Ornithinimicrobium sp.]